MCVRFHNYNNFHDTRINVADECSGRSCEMNYITRSNECDHTLYIPLLYVQS